MSLLARIYDPLGLLTPFTVLAKCLFQEMWALKLKWDDVLPDDAAELFRSWMEGCRQLQEVKVQHCFTSLSETDWTSLTASTDPDLELHVFADASPRAYGSCMYMRIRQPDDPSEYPS